ncbi:MAG: hypothetical protein V4621_06435 [Pseudomonadota bacterium]
MKTFFAKPEDIIAAKSQLIWRQGHGVDINFSPIHVNAISLQSAAAQYLQLHQQFSMRNILAFDKAILAAEKNYYQTLQVVPLQRCKALFVEHALNMPVIYQHMCHEDVYAVTGFKIEAMLKRLADPDGVNPAGTLRQEFRHATGNDMMLDASTLYQLVNTSAQPFRVAIVQQGQHDLQASCLDVISRVIETIIQIDKKQTLRTCKEDMLEQAHRIDAFNHYAAMCKSISDTLIPLPAVPHSTVLHFPSCKKGLPVACVT